MDIANRSIYIYKYIFICVDLDIVNRYIYKYISICVVTMLYLQIEVLYYYLIYILYY